VLMRFRLGLVIGFGAGYYLGSQAGRERYEEINRLLKKVKRTDVYETASDKTKAVIDLGVERAKDVIEEQVDKARGNGADINTAEADVNKTWPDRMDPVVRP
jgi:hypothetical protein